MTKIKINKTFKNRREVVQVPNKGLFQPEAVTLLQLLCTQCGLGDTQPSLPVLPRAAPSATLHFHSPHYSCLALQKTNFGFCLAMTWIQIWWSTSSSLGHGFLLWDSCLHECQWEKNQAHHTKWKTSWCSATSRETSVERAVCFWQETEGCTGSTLWIATTQRCKAAESYNNTQHKRSPGCGTTQLGAGTGCSCSAHPELNLCSRVGYFHAKITHKQYRNEWEEIVTY